MFERKMKATVPQKPKRMDFGEELQMPNPSHVRIRNFEFFPCQTKIKKK